MVMLILVPENCMICSDYIKPEFLVAYHKGGEGARKQPNPQLSVNQTQVTTNAGNTTSHTSHVFSDATRNSPPGLSMQEEVV